MVLHRWHLTWLASMARVTQLLGSLEQEASVVPAESPGAGGNSEGSGGAFSSTPRLVDRCATLVIDVVNRCVAIDVAGRRRDAAGDRDDGVSAALTSEVALRLLCILGVSSSRYSRHDPPPLPRGDPPAPNARHAMPSSSSRWVFPITTHWRLAAAVPPETLGHLWAIVTSNRRSTLLPPLAVSTAEEPSPQHQAAGYEEKAPAAGSHTHQDVPAAMIPSPWRQEGGGGGWRSGGYSSTTPLTASQVTQAVVAAAQLRTPWELVAPVIRAIRTIPVPRGGALDVLAPGDACASFLEVHQLISALYSLLVGQLRSGGAVRTVGGYSGTVKALLDEGLVSHLVELVGTLPHSAIAMDGRGDKEVEDGWDVDTQNTSSSSPRRGYIRVPIAELRRRIMLPRKARAAPCGALLRREMVTLLEWMHIFGTTAQPIVLPPAADAVASSTTDHGNSDGHRPHHAIAVAQTSMGPHRMLRGSLIHVGRGVHLVALDEYDSGGGATIVATSQRDPPLATSLGREGPNKGEGGD